MKDPVRLVDALDDELTLELLQAGIREKPSRAVMQQTLISLSVGAAVVASASQAPAVLGGLGASASSVGAGGAGITTGASVSGAALAGAAGSGAAVSGAALGKASMGLVMAKWASVGVVASASVVGAVQLSEPRVDHAAMRTSGGLAEPATTQPSALRGPSSDRNAKSKVAEVPVSETTEDEKAARPVSAATSLVRDRSLAEGPSQTLLLEEIQLVDGARQLLSSGDADAALKKLATHGRQFPRGRLAPEALFLRLQAELALGLTSAANQSARQVLERYPGGPHAGKAREVLGQ
jgi:hypothetical protein